MEKGVVVYQLSIVGSVTTKVWILIVLALLLFTGTASAQEGPAIANAGPDQTVLDNETVLLDGRQSQGMSFQWSQADPSDPNVNWIVGPDNITATFSLPPDVTGDSPLLPLQFRLDVIGILEDVDTDFVDIYVFDSDRVADAAFAPDGQPIGIGVDPGNLVTFTVIPSDTVTTSVSITGPQPEDILHGALVDSGIDLSGTGVISSTVSLFFANQVPSQYDVGKLSRAQGKWFDISNRTVFSPARDVVSYTVTDNDPEDDDTAVDIIADPAGLVVMPSGGSGGGGGGGGCFIATAATL